MKKISFLMALVMMIMTTLPMLASSETEYAEAPMLARQVADGTLPPIGIACLPPPRSTMIIPTST